MQTDRPPRWRTLTPFIPINLNFKCQGVTCQKISSSLNLYTHAVYLLSERRGIKLAACWVIVDLQQFALEWKWMALHLKPFTSHPGRRLASINGLQHRPSVSHQRGIQRTFYKLLIAVLEGIVGTETFFLLLSFFFNKTDLQKPFFQPV